MFVEARTRSVLAEVCRRLGYPSADAVLLRHHTNAVYAVEDVVVKIAPPRLGMDRLRWVTQLVLWLTARGFPTVELSPRLSQPIEVEGLSVTVWQRLDLAQKYPVTVAELGGLLRELHALPPPPTPLPRLRPAESIQRSIVASPILTDRDRSLLLSRLDDLAKAWDSPVPHDICLIQSDPQVRNALRRADGAAVLADWDGAAIGPREWDVATVAVHCRRFMADEPSAFASFVTAYGWDPNGWDGFEDLCRLRELQMITTNARKSAPGTAAATEVHRRIAALRNGTSVQHRWHIL